MALDEIDSFEKYLENRQVVKSSSRASEAVSLFERSEKKFRNMERLGVSEETSTDYFENVYEAIKIFLQSFMALDGYKPYKHESIIAYGVEELNITASEANKLNRYRKLRNDISYRGETVSVREAAKIRRLFRELRDRLEPEFEKRKK